MSTRGLFLGMLFVVVVAGAGVIAIALGSQPGPASMEAAAPTPESIVPGDPASAAAADRPAWHSIRFTDARTGAELTLADFAGRTVIVEGIATWCTNCLRQQRNAAQALPSLGEGMVYISLGVDPSEDAPLLASFAERQGFSWVFGISSRELTTALVEQFGRAVTSPPSVPMFIIAPDGRTSSLYTGFHSPEELTRLVADFQG